MDIDVNLSRKFQSFTGQTAVTGLPQFVILTGKNGAGKTQLLKLLSSAYYSSPTPEGVSTIIINSANTNRRDILHITGWDMPPAVSTGASDLYNISIQIQSAVNQLLAQQGANVRDGMPMFSTRQFDELDSVVRQLREQGFDISTSIPDLDRDIIPLLSADFENHSGELLNERISRIIYAEHFKALDEKRDIAPDKDPVNMFNELCADFEMNFHLAPFQTALKPYIPTLYDESDNPVDWSQLSAGEMVIFRIITWLFYYKNQHTINPRLMLLDEPDAHLSPKMIRKFLSTIQEVVVGQMGIAVIMTSHSPNTIALSEEAALYELQKSGSTHEIIKIAKNDALLAFSEGIVFVQEKVKMIFLEGKADKPFYAKMYDIAVTKHGLSSRPPLNLMSVSEDDPDEGGCTKVVAMVRKFDGTPMLDLITGIIDRDKDNQASNNIKVLTRYSIENFLYDPVVILVALIRSGRHGTHIPEIANVDTNDIESVLMSDELLQPALDTIIALIHGSLTETKLDESLVVCKMRMKFGSGLITYSLPQWFIDIKKHDLMTGALRKDGQQLKPDISEGAQYLALDSAGLIHEDIYDLFAELIS